MAVDDLTTSPQAAAPQPIDIEAWTEQVNSGKAPAEQFFVMGSLARRIEELVAAKPA